VITVDYSEGSTESRRYVAKIRSCWNYYLACTNCSLDAGFSKMFFCF